MIINIGGDFCITKEYLSKNLFDNSIRDIFKNGDINLVNLECPVNDHKRDTRIIKTGPHLRTDEKILEKIQELNIHAVTLANNHILDYGKEGLDNTISALKQKGIYYVGAGSNRQKARNPLHIEKQGLKIAFVNFCENEWSVAGENTAGANGMDIIDDFNQIQQAQNEADFVIVIVHGGHEYYNLPSPRMVKQYRFYAENGADAVIGHHPHCISGYEYHKGVPIAYSLGNMIFTLKNNNVEWYNGLIAQLSIQKNKKINIDFIPVEQQYGNFQLIKLSKSKYETFEKKFNTLNEIIKDKNRLIQEWETYLKNKKHKLQLFNPLNGIKGKALRGFLKLIFSNPIFLRNQYFKMIFINFLCDSHRELNLELMKKKFKK